MLAFILPRIGFSAAHSKVSIFPEDPVTPLDVPTERVLGDAVVQLLETELASREGLELS